MGQVQTELPDQKMLWAEFGLASRLGELMLTKIPTVPVRTKWIFDNFPGN